MVHKIDGDNYHIYDDEGNVLFAIKLENDFPSNQVIIATPKEIYSWPLKFLSFGEK